MKKIVNFFEEDGYIIIICIGLMVSLFIVALFAPYNVTYTLTIDGVTYDCVDFTVNDDVVEIHTECIPSSSLPHSKYCSFYTVKAENGYSCDKHFERGIDELIIFFTK